MGGHASQRPPSDPGPAAQLSRRLLAMSAPVSATPPAGQLIPPAQRFWPAR